MEYNMNFGQKCHEYAEKGLYSMMADYVTSSKDALRENLSIIGGNVANNDHRDKAYQVMTETICLMADISDTPGLKRHRHGEKALGALTEAMSVILEAQVALSQKRLNDDILNESFEMSGCMFLAESNPYIEHFKNEIKIHPKAKGSMKNLTAEERKQFFKDVAVKWHAKKKDAATKDIKKRDEKITSHLKEGGLENLGDKAKEFEKKGDKVVDKDRKEVEKEKKGDTKKEECKK